MEFKEQIQRILENVPKVYEAGSKSIIVQETGYGEGVVMSQKATTEELERMSKRVEKLEYAAKGILYKDKINEGIAKSVTITDDVLPYGAISMVGGASYIRLRNLVPYPYLLTGPSYTTNGVTRILHPDGSFSVKGTCTKNFNMWLFTKSYGWNPGKHKFSLSGCPAGGADDKYYLQIALFETADATVPLLQVRDYGDGVIFDARHLDYECMTLLFVVKSGASVDCTVRPQLDNGVVTDWEPYTIKHAPVKKIFIKHVVPEGAYYPYSVVDLVNSNCDVDRESSSFTCSLSSYSDFMGAYFYPQCGKGNEYTIFLRLTSCSSQKARQCIDLEKSYICLYDSSTRVNSEYAYFNDILDEGRLRYVFTHNGVRREHIKVYVKFLEQLPQGTYFKGLYDIRKGSVSAPKDVFWRTLAYEVPDELMQNCQDYGHGAGYSENDHEPWFNYIDFENRQYCQNVMVCDHDEYNGFLSDGTNYLTTNYHYDEVTDVSQYINENDLIIPLAKGDVISFETEDGEVPMPVPYAIKYQVKV